MQSMAAPGFYPYAAVNNLSQAHVAYIIIRCPDKGKYFQKYFTAKRIFPAYCSYSPGKSKSGSIKRNNQVIPGREFATGARHFIPGAAIPYNREAEVKMSITKTPADKNYWEALFNARTIAVAGAKNAAGTWGQDAMRAALDAVKAKAGRQAYPVNNRETEVMGLKAYASVTDIPGEVDLAVIVVPAANTPQVFRDCARKGVKAAVVITAGFAEVDENGRKLEEEITAIARGAGMRFTGPNCVGHADLHTRIASIGIASMIPAGPLALLSQSGTLGASIIQLAAGRGIGLSKFVATGNEADLRLEDCLEYLGSDGDTRIIAAYIEGLREGRRFYELAKQITREKPIIVMKSGTTEAAARAAKSHTGALSGSDAVYNAAFRQAGVIRVEDEEELCDTAIALRDLPLPKGNRVGMLTIGGGFGVVAAGICEKEGLKIADLETQTVEKLKALLPPRWTPGNPIDLVGTRPAPGDTTGDKCIHALLEDHNVDMVISLVPPLIIPPSITMTPEQLKAIHEEIDKRQEALYRTIKETEKPMVYVRRLTFTIGQKQGTPTAPKPGIPEYSHPERAARVLRYLADYRHYLESR